MKISSFHVRGFFRWCGVIVLLCASGHMVWGAGTFHGFSQFEKVKGRPDLGYAQLYEYKAFLSPEGDGTGYSYHCGDPGTCPQPYTGCMYFPGVPAGRYALLSCFPEFLPRGVVVSNIVVLDSQTTQRNANQPMDYSGYLTKDQWDPVGANPIFQTFLAQGTSVSRIAFAKADDNRLGSIRISVHRDNGGTLENWPQVGPERVVSRQGYGADHWASWDAGQVPLVAGTMYAVRLFANDGPNVQPYWCDDSLYPQGRGYRATNASPAGHDYYIAVFTDSDGTIATMQTRDYDGGNLAGSSQRWAQSYTARGPYLAGVAAKATLGGVDGWNFPLKITIRPSTPSSGPVGPAKIMPNAFAPYIGVSGVAYNPGEVPTTVGQTYWIVYERPNGASFNMSRQRDGDTYAGGTAAAQATTGQWVNMPYDLYMHIYEYAPGTTPLPTLVPTVTPTPTLTRTPTLTPTPTPRNLNIMETR